MTTNKKLNARVIIMAVVACVLVAVYGISASHAQVPLLPTAYSSNGTAILTRADAVYGTIQDAAGNVKQSGLIKQTEINAKSEGEPVDVSTIIADISDIDVAYPLSAQYFQSGWGKLNSRNAYDISVEADAAVVAAASGTVVFSAPFNFGYLVLVDNGKGYTTSYLCGDSTLAMGDTVARGDNIGMPQEVNENGEKTYHVVFNIYKDGKSLFYDGGKNSVAAAFEAFKPLLLSGKAKQNDFAKFYKELLK